MPDHSVKDLGLLVAANPQVAWDRFVCTPVLEFDRTGKAQGTARRCAITADGMTITIRLPHQMAIGKAHWPPEGVVDAMSDALGPMVEV